MLRFGAVFDRFGAVFDRFGAVFDCFGAVFDRFGDVFDRSGIHKWSLRSTGPRKIKNIPPWLEKSKTLSHGIIEMLLLLLDLLLLLLLLLLLYVFSYVLIRGREAPPL